MIKACAEAGHVTEAEHSLCMMLKSGVDNSLAVRLEDSSFMETFSGPFQNFTAEQIVTLMSDSLAVRL